MEQPNFDLNNDLIPAVIQDYQTNEVLMVGYMNNEAWSLTLEVGKVHYYSRKKKRIWLKGEQSGNYQIVKEIYLNCDNTCLLIKVEQIGGACDQGYKSCFDKVLVNGEFVEDGIKIFDPQSAYGKNYSPNIILGIPSGSLEPMTFTLLNQAGYKLIRSSERSYHPVIENEPNIKILMARAQELPCLLDEGIIDAAITGLDMVRESGFSSIRDIADLCYNKLGIGPVILSLAVPNDISIDNMQYFQDKRIATAYPNITTQYFNEKEITVKVIPSIGATEGKVPLIADAIVDLVETGITLEANFLKPVLKIWDTTVHFITTNKVWGYTWKRRALEKISSRLVIASQNLPPNPKRIIDLATDIASDKLDG